MINRRWDSPGVADRKIGVSFSVAVVGTAAPAWKEPVYGVPFWVNGTGRSRIPKNPYYHGRGARSPHHRHAESDDWAGQTNRKEELTLEQGNE